MSWSRIGRFGAYEARGRAGRYYLVFKMQHSWKAIARSGQKTEKEPAGKTLGLCLAATLGEAQTWAENAELAWGASNV